MADEITFKDLSFRKKVDHIWTYYRWLIIAGLFVVLVIIPLIVQVFTTPKALMDVIMLDSDAMGNSSATGFGEFLTEYGYEVYDGAVSLNTNLGFFSEEEMNRMNEEDASAAVQSNYEKEQMLFSLMAGGGSELFFGKDEYFLAYADEGLLTDLRTVLSAQLLEQYKEQLVYTDEYGETASYPCAVALSGNAWLMENGYYDECYFGILNMADNPEIAAQFAEFLLNQ